MSTPQTSPRRVKASPKYPGVYYREAGDGQRHYELDLRTVGGGWETVGPMKLSEAVALRGERIAAAKLQGQQLSTGPGPTFGDVRREWEAARRIRDRTAAGYDSNLRLYAAGFDPKRIRSIDRPQLVLWLGQLHSAKTGGRLAEGTEALVLAAVSAVFEYAVTVGYRGSNPVKEIKGDHRPRQGQGRRRILTHDEEARLLGACDRTPWLRPIITVALYQALRLGEGPGLQVPDVDFDRGKLRVHQQLDSTTDELGPTKGAKVRGGVVVRCDPRDVHPIDLMPAAHAALREAICDRTEGFVFLNSLSDRRRTRDVSRAFTNAVERARLAVTDDGPVTFHALRHTGISRLANHPRIPLVFVRDFAGHASLRTTETYVHKIESDAVTAAAAEAMGGQAVETPQAAAGLRRVQ